LRRFGASTAATKQALNSAGVTARTEQGNDSGFGRVEKGQKQARPSKLWNSVRHLSDPLQFHLRAGPPADSTPWPGKPTSGSPPPPIGELLQNLNEIRLDFMPAYVVLVHRTLE